MLASGLLSAALLARPETDPVTDEGAEGPWWQTYTTATAHIQSLTLLESLPICMLLISALSSLIGMFGQCPFPTSWESWILICDHFWLEKLCQCKTHTW